MEEFVTQQNTSVGHGVAGEDPGPVVGTLLRSRPALVATGAIVLALIGTSVLYLGKPATPADHPSPKAVPGNLQSAIADAARSCQSLTFARMAAQVMSASEFDEHAVTARGGNGIAGLTDAEWTQWMPHPSAGRDDSAANIMALAHEMCDFVGQVRSGGVTGDLWQLALATYHAGPAAVRQAGGVPSTAASYVNEVASYAVWYEKAEADPAPETSAPAVDEPSVVMATPSAPSISESPSLPSPPASTPGPAARTPGKPKPPAPQAPPQQQPQPPAPPTWTTVVVSATTVLGKGQSVRSNRTRVAFSAEGNLEIFDENNRLRWTSDTARRGGFQAVFQADGNLAVYDQNRQSLWTSGTGGHDGAVLVLEADGNVCVVYHSIVIWASNTAH